MTRPNVQTEEFRIPLATGNNIFLKRLLTKPGGKPLLCLHGAFDNGRIFYNRTLKKGLAVFLARAGFDVFVPDLRGHGQSQPPLNRHSRYGLHEIIAQDLPVIIDFIGQHNPQPLGWVGHSDGGVFLLSTLARHPRLLRHTTSIVLLACKRAVKTRTLKQALVKHLLWYGIGHALVWVFGYQPSKLFRIGSDNDTKLFMIERKAWVLGGPWTDPRDQFSYAEAILELEIPPVLSLAAQADWILGHPLDVEVFFQEIAARHSQFKILGKKTGHLHDYDHVSIVTHPDAEEDHFPIVKNWLETGGVDARIDYST